MKIGPREMKIGSREINHDGASPYIIAEISCNHSGSLLRAKQLIMAAKRSGADAVKTQCL
jgi:pseudaminic acid synthase